MASYNKVMLMGNITRDIELRYTPKGTAVSDISLACNRVRTGDDGQKIEEVTFVDVTLWGRQAELANQYLGKGKPVFIEGRLSMDSWTDKETGKQRSKLKVVGEVMQFLGAPGGSGNSGGGGNAPQQNQNQNYNQNQGQTQNQNQGQQQSQGYNAPPQQQQQQAQQPNPGPPQGGSPATNMPDFVEEDDDIPF